MVDTDIEKEVQARVEFKMNEFITSLKNMVGYKYAQAFDMTQKSQYIWESFKEISEMAAKERDMACPHDEMDNHNKRSAKNKAVDVIMERIQPILDGRHSNERNSIVRVIVSAIERAQDY